jgi:hypothetical protein
VSNSPRLHFGRSRPPDPPDLSHAVTSEMVAGPSDASISHPDKLDHVRLYNLADEIPERV